MQLHIEGQRTAIPAPLLSCIAERLEDLNTARQSMFRARVTLRRCEHHLHSSYQARVILTRAGKTFRATGSGTTLDEAVHMALAAIAGAVHKGRASQLVAT